MEASFCAERAPDLAAVWREPNPCGPASRESLPYPAQGRGVPRHPRPRPGGMARDARRGQGAGDHAQGQARPGADRPKPNTDTGGEFHLPSCLAVV